MSLKNYIQKRDFRITTEPKTSQKNKRNEKIFVIQFHQARKDHFDFRIEFNGVLVSWAVPKGLPTNSKDKRLAVKVEDHPLSYANFEGIIPPKQYGAGKVEIWDKGTYIANSSIRKGLKDGKISINLIGDRLKGSWALVRMQEDNWLAIKEEDKIDFSQNKTFKSSDKQKKLPFSKIDVELCTLQEIIPTGKEWLFEIKYDGYRIVSFLNSTKVQMFTRSHIDYTEKFPFIAESLLKFFKNQQVVLDGEVVCFDKDGKSDFGMLQNAIKQKDSNLSYVVFDILAYEGKDLRNLELMERKKLLNNLFDKPCENLVLSQYVINKGKQCYNFAKKNNLEGIVAKKIDSKYVGKRTMDWLKIKCYFRQEFVIVGYTKTSKNKKLSAVLVGYCKNNKFIYIGKVGTGFTEKTRTELSKKFEKIITNKPCVINTEHVDDCAIWLKPTLVAEIQFAEITKDQLLRQASFVGLREDKKPQEVKLEYWNPKNKQCEHISPWQNTIFKIKTDKTRFSHVLQKSKQIYVEIFKQKVTHWIKMSW